MKKTLLLVTGMLLCAPLAYTANAVDLAQTNPGDQVTITLTAGKVPGAPAKMTFDPSTNVKMFGSSDAQSFGIGAYHEQALNKKAGQAYAMIADSNKMYFQDISETSTAPTIPTSSGGIKASAVWTTM